MTPAPGRAVLLDTDVFSAVFVSRDSAVKQGLPVEAWEAALEGYRVLISVQTVAELIAGALAASWGGRRLAALRALLAATPVIPVDPDVIDAYRRLPRQAGLRGMPLRRRFIPRIAGLPHPQSRSRCPSLPAIGFTKGRPAS